MLSGLLTKAIFSTKICTLLFSKTKIWRVSDIIFGHGLIIITDIIYYKIPHHIFVYYLLIKGMKFDIQQCFSEFYFDAANAMSALKYMKNISKMSLYKTRQETMIQKIQVEVKLNQGHTHTRYSPLKTNLDSSLVTKKKTTNLKFYSNNLSIAHDTSLYDEKIIKV